MPRFPTMFTAALCATTALSLPAQSVATHIASGDAAYAALHAPDALRHYLAALAADSGSVDALWRASRTESELAEYDTVPGSATALREGAERHATAAVANGPKNPEAHFALALALGHSALMVSTAERLPYATRIHAEVETCLALVPKHAGCLHILAIWAAEYLRLSPVMQDLANGMTGGKLFASATWDEAERDLREAIRLEPRRAIHHLDLGRVLASQGKNDSARVELQAVLDAPARDYNDPHYRAEATAAIARLSRADSGDESTHDRSREAGA